MIPTLKYLPLAASLFVVTLLQGISADVFWNEEQLRQAAICLAPREENAAKRKPRGPTTDEWLEKSAEDLKTYIQKMTGVDVEIVRASRVADIPKGKPAFVLGKLAVELGAKPPETSFREDGYVIELKGNHLLMAGEGHSGHAYAVADFLHRQGVRWYMPGPYGEEVPKRDKLTLPSRPIRETPNYESRLLWLNGGAGNRFAEASPDVPEWFSEWARRNRLNVENRLPTMHMWNAIFRSNKMTREEAFEKHPDWFLVINGKRNPRQLNLLNDEVVGLFVNHFRKALANDPKDISRILSISPDDQIILNQDVGAQEVMGRKDMIFTNLPDATDYLIQFNNRVIEEVNKEYPNVRLAFYIYSNYQNAPTLVKMHRNLIPFLAPLNFSRYHALTDRTKPSRTLLAEIVDRWHATGSTIGWRDYSFLCPDVLMPFNRLHMTRKDIPWLYEHGARYMNTETVSNWPNLLPEFYLLSRLLWDVKTDQKKELQEFYTRFFGPAAKSMETYITMVSETYNRLPFSSGNKEFVGTAFPPEHLRKLRELVDQAKKETSGSEIYRHRVLLIEAPLKQLERFVKMRDAVNRFDYAEAAKWNDQIINAFEEDLKFDQNTNTLFVRDAWYNRFYGNHVKTVNEWLDGAEVVHVFGDEWPANLDFTQTGEAEGYTNPQTDAFDLFSLKTYSRSLAEQGWEKFRGHIWYRQRFPEIKVPDGKKLYVVFGGVDRWVHVWINGKAVGEGTGGRGFDPVLLPAEKFETGKENTLTVRVNNEAITELGVGGIIRPVALVIK